MIMFIHLNQQSTIMNDMIRKLQPHVLEISRVYMGIDYIGTAPSACRQFVMSLYNQAMFCTGLMSVSVIGEREGERMIKHANDYILGAIMIKQSGC